MAANGMRVQVDGTTHPIHDGATGVNVTLTFASGEIAQVQVAKVGSELVLIVAGDIATDQDPRGNFRARIAPT